VVGHKPTYGLVPYTGCMMIEMTLDHCGPMANSVADVAAMLSVLAGPDGLDPRQRGVVPADYVRDYAPAIGQGVAGKRIALVKEGFEQAPWEDLGLPGSEEVVDAKVRAAAERLREQGAAVDEVSIPMHIDGAYIFTAIIREGATEFMVKGNNTGSNWQGFYNTRLLEAVARGVAARPNDLPVTVKTVMLMGEYMKRYYHGRYYAKAQNLRPALVKAYDDVLADYDALVMPTIPFRATPIPPPDCSIEDCMGFALNMTNNTAQFNATGHPSISVPCGMEDDLPIGMMITGRHFDDFTVLQIADAVEKSGDWKSF
jgi:amidase